LALHLGRDAVSGVPHLETNHHGVRGLLDHLSAQQDFAGRSELDGVGQEVVENLPQTF
jgi:hypothetical protein